MSEQALDSRIQQIAKYFVENSNISNREVQQANLQELQSQLSSIVKMRPSAYKTYAAYFKSYKEQNQNSNHAERVRLKEENIQKSRILTPTLKFDQVHENIDVIKSEISPDKSLITAYIGNNTARIYDILGNLKFEVVLSPNPKQRKVFISDDGTHVIHLSPNKTFMIHNQLGKKLFESATSTKVTDIEWDSANNLIYATTQSGQILTINIQGQTIKKLQNKDFKNTVMINPLQQTAAIVSKNFFTYYDISGSKEIKILFKKMKDDIHDVQFNPSTNTVLISAKFDSFVTDGINSFDITPIEQQTSINMFSPDGQNIINTQKNGPIQIYDNKGNELRRISLPQSEMVRKIVVSPDSKYMAVVFSNSSVKIYDMNGEFITEIQHDGIKTLQFYKDSTILATGSFDGSLKLSGVLHSYTLYELNFDGSAKHLHFSKDFEHLSLSFGNHLVLLAL